MHRQCDSDVLCSLDTLGSYRLLAGFSPQPASPTLHLTQLGEVVPSSDLSSEKKMEMEVR